MLFTTQWLTSIFTQYRGEACDLIPIERVNTDSRKEAKRSLFIPIVGENFDGHDYIKEAFNHGAVATIWDRKKDLPRFLPTDFPVFFVDDTLHALQQLATAYRDRVNPTVIGITGSNGKTTTKDFVSSVLKQSFRTHYTQGNFNNHIGLPLTILSMDTDTEMLVLEMGMSDFGEIDLLSRIAQPTIAIITNIGESHLEFLGTREGIAKAKLEITNGLTEDGLLIIDGDEKLLEHLRDDYNIIRCGYHEHNDVIIQSYEINNQQTTFQLSNEKSYTIPLLGKHHAKNATYAIALGKKLGISDEKIYEALSTVALTSMRFEITEGKKGVSIINDAYNASPTSMKAAIDVVKQIEGFQNKVLVLGDIFELGEQSKRLHRSIGDVIEPPITALFTYGKAAEVISSTVQKHQTEIVCEHFSSKSELMSRLLSYVQRDTLILFKASRGMAFETLVEELQKK
ncbi:MAG TPA: UDP-N-acetylmuramoyl-tripeptide--D-alanyl-D-alanine ligase [Bacillota bacterium]